MTPVPKAETVETKYNEQRADIQPIIQQIKKKSEQEFQFEEKQKHILNSRSIKISNSEAQKILTLIKEGKLSWNKVQRVFFHLKILLSKSKGDDYIYWLKYLPKLIELGYGEMVVKDAHLQWRLIQMFNSSFKHFLIEPANKSLSYIIFQISVIAELVKTFPYEMHPFNKDFIEHTIKLSSFSVKIKEIEGKLSMVFLILYQSFTNQPQLYNNETLIKTFNQHMLNQIKNQKKFKKEKNQILSSINFIYQNFHKKVQSKFNTLKEICENKNYFGQKIQKSNCCMMKFELLTICGTVGVGICIQTSIQSKYFQFQSSYQLGHGLFILCSDGISFSHSDKQHHKVQTGLEYFEGDLIAVEINKDQLQFKNQTQNWQYKIHMKLEEESQKFSFCVISDGTGNCCVSIGSEELIQF